MHLSELSLLERAEVPYERLAISRARRLWLACPIVDRIECNWASVKRDAQASIEVEKLSSGTDLGKADSVENLIELEIAGMIAMLAVRRGEAGKMRTYHVDTVMQVFFEALLKTKPLAQTHAPVDLSCSISQQMLNGHSAL